MTDHDGHVRGACAACREGLELDFDFSMAFQPIVDVDDRRVFAYEALVRGTDGAGAASVLDRVNEGNRYRFDQRCRVRAVELAAKLGIDCYVSINFLPNAVYEPSACIQSTLSAAKANGFPLSRLMFEITESEDVVDKAHLKRIISDYQGRGFLTAIDDFGAGYAGLGLLAEFQPDVIKLDMSLVRDIDTNRVRQAIVGGILSACHDLDIDVIGEGVESTAELDWLRARGIRYFQGYLFAKPGFESLPQVKWPSDARQ